MKTSMSFADRMSCIPESFIREILKVSTKPEMISFAGGLPNPKLFPLEQMAEAAEKVIRCDGRVALQYAPTEGYLPLRAYLAERQSVKEGVAIMPEQVIMLTGSQQGLDLTGKLFCNKGQSILLEEPSYLGAIQAFSAYEPQFLGVRLTEEGPDRTDFINMIHKGNPAFFYCIPNFQNPTGYSYSTSRRLELVESAFHSDMLWIEDNPYGEINFSSEHPPDFHSLIPGKTIHLGSFSKIISPGMRLGWATGPLEVIRKMAVAKQASDLHSSSLIQRIVYQFLCDNSLDDHLTSIRTFYSQQATTMVSLMREHFPSEVKWADPKGGMFIWVTLPENVEASAVLEKAIEENVLFVPGENFFVLPGTGRNTLRLNFSNPSEAEMKKGVMSLSTILRSAI